jgi:hypothetical protein
MGSLKRGSSFKNSNATTTMMRFPTKSLPPSNSPRKRPYRHCQQIHPVVAGGIVSERLATSSRTVGHSPGFRISSVHGLQSLYVSIRREEGRR